MARSASSRYFGMSGVPLAIVPAMEDSRETHSHEFHELVIVAGGYGTHVVMGVSQGVREGDAFVVKAGMEHGYRDGQGLFLYNILFDPYLLSLPFEFLERMPGYNDLFSMGPRRVAGHCTTGVARLDSARLREALDIVSEMSGELNTKAIGYEACTHTLFSRLVVMLSRVRSEVITADTKGPLDLANVLGYMESRYSEDPGTRELASLCHVSVSHFIKAFKLQTGMTPQRYLMGIRIKRAMQILQGTDASVSAVAQMTGFFDGCHMARYFRRYLGISPRDARRMGRSESR